MPNIADIFKAYDVRGKVGEELTPEVTLAVGKAFATWLPDAEAVVVGYDMRPDSKELAQALIEGLTEQGRDVLDIGQVTSDMVYFATGHLSLAGGVMITASHNPGEYNGIKFCGKLASAVGEASGLLDIRDLAIANKFTPAATKGTVTSKDISEDWINHVLSFIDVKELRDLKLVVDAGNGMAGKIFPEIEPYVPFEVTELYFDLDGTFPNHIANPMEPENLVDAQKAIKDNHADVGLAFDGDGDRAVLIDEKGEPLSGTVMTAILAKYFLEKYPGSTILCNAICGRVVPETVESNGGKSIRTRVGHSYIKADMKEYGAVFAGEHSGHYYFKDNYNADSGLIAAMVALFILSKSKQKLSELAAPYRQAYTQIQETNFEVNDKEGVIDKIAAEFNTHPQERLDGLTVGFKNAWFNVRPSNTESLLRLNAEAKTDEELDNIVSAVTKLISS